MEDLSQWQCEFRGQIVALREWLKSMEMRLPPLDPQVAEGSSACMAERPSLAYYLTSLWAKGLWVTSSAGPAASATSPSM